MPAERIDLLTADPEPAIARARRLLSEDGVVLLPTETMYALAGRLTSLAARQKLRSARPPSLPASPAPTSPLTLHLASPKQAHRYLTPDLIPPGSLAERLVRRLWPGPVGLVFDVPPDARTAVAQSLHLPPHELFDAQGRITLRCPDHPTAQAVLAATQDPIVLTQAQTPSSRPAHRLADVATLAFDIADLALDAGPTRYQKPSTLLRVLPDRFELLRAGVYDQRILQRMLTSTLLFVCSGNTCRSPMAMALARKLLADHLGITESALESRGIRVLSAGTMAFPGARATPQAQQAARDLGADLASHRSQPLTVELIHQAHTIYAMGRSHRAAVLALVPSAADKTFTLDPTGDIEDPIGSDVSVYQSLARHLQSLIAARLAERPL